MDRQKTYTASDFHRYHNGEMTAAEMNALEKAALDDPFLADAIEGFTYSSHPEREMETLQKDLEERIGRNKRKVVALPRLSRGLKVAALVLLLAGFAWIAYQLPLGNSNNDVARSFEPTPKKSGTEKMVSTVTLDSTSTATVPLKPHPPVERLSKPGKKIIHKAEQYNDRVPAKKEENNLTAIPVMDTNAPVAFSAPQVEKKMQQPVVEAKISNNEIQGIVKKNNGEPVPYASVNIPGGAHTVTGNDGKFIMKSPDSNAVVNINAVGFDNTNSVVRMNDSNVIVLKETSSQLSEVVVTGYGKPKKLIRKQIIESGDLEPEAGWTQYNEYIAAKLKPATDADIKDRGKVELSFEINDKGEPVNITVESSQCVQCNEQAIKLLKEGPKWTSRKGKKGRIAFKF
jgi:hypothetical protein